MAKSTKAPQDVTKASPKIHYPFWFGGSAASMAAVVTHPLDLVKVRLQTRGPSDPKTMLSTFVHIAKNQGILGLYNGLSASLLRQLTYSTVRFGAYEELKSRYPSSTSLPALILMSSVSGFVGGIAGNPGDVLNVRMQSDFAKPEAQRRNYKHALDGLVRMVREEGPASLFKGVWPNSTRALLMTTSQLASYDAFKRIATKNFNMGDNLTTHFTCSFAAGFVATTVCSPVDVIKTRIMSASAEEGKSGLVTLIRNVYAKEGFAWMFRGWVPSFIRLGPQTVVTMMFFEQHKKIYRRLKGLDDDAGKKL